MIQSKLLHRGVGSIKRLGGGTGFQGHFWILKRALKKLFPEMLARGGGKKYFLAILYRNYTFLTPKLFLKTWKFPNKKGTFDVNLVFTATLACTKRTLFITKKGTFVSLKQFGGGEGGTCPLCPPGSYSPASARPLRVYRINILYFGFERICLVSGRVN